jgi:flagellar M-ring protein FliF
VALVGGGDRIGNWWRGSNATQRALLIGGILAGVLSVALVVRWSARPDFVVLFAGLPPDEAAAILEDLDEAQIPHRVASSGGTILVPSDRVGELRIRAAGKGLTGKAVVGYEIFDRQSLGMTDFLQHVNYRRALEGELVRTMVSLEEIRNARVHLAIPERDVFLRKSDEPKASVIVDLEPGARLRPDQVRGIYALVSASVEGLRPSGVTVVDTSGRELGGGGGSEEFAATSEQLRIQQEVETHLREKARGLLEQVVGQGKATVQVTAALDFERVERSIETYDPEKTVIRSEQRITGAGSAGDSQETTLTNYEIDKTVQRILGSVGTIQRLSVAVLVDGVETPTAGGAPAYAERPAEELATLAAIVQDAVGYDETRGDTFEIASLRFAPLPGADLEGSPLPWWLLFPSMGSLLRSLLLLVAIALVAWGLRQSSSILVEAVEADRKRRERVLALEKKEDEGELRREVIREQMNDLAHNRPTEVAQVLRGWLVEEKP